MQTRKVSIHETFLLSLLTVGFSAIFFIGFFWVKSEWMQFEKEADVLRASYLQERKDLLKREVNRALDFVNYMQSQTEVRLKDDIKKRVYEACAIAESIYEKQAELKNIQNIETIIKESLRSIRFNKGRGYFFAFNLEGVETLFSVSPEMEGKNMLPVLGGKGEAVVSDMLAIVKKKGEGFYQYTWPKPDEKGYFPKIAFVKHFEPIGWVIGAGEYLDDVKKDIQQECVKWISNIKFGKDGYVFAGKWNGLILSGPATGKNMSNVEDANGVKIVRELIRAAKNGGGFVEYVMPGFEGKKQARKISYAVSVPEWRWYIGSGLYLDEIESEVAGRHADLKSRIKNNIRTIFFILFLITAFIFLVVKLFLDRIKKNLVLFDNFFARASSESAEIQIDKIYFSEFCQLAQSANEMVQKQKSAEEALQTSHQRFLTVLDGIDATIYAADLETFEILFMNKHMIESFGRDMTGEICWDSFRNEPGPCAHCNNDQLVDKNGKPSGVCVWQGKNPVTGKWYINYDRAIEWTDGRLVRLQIATDITDIKRLEEELRQAHRMEAIGTLASGIAHDFNNLLMGIQGRISLMSVEPDRRNHDWEHIEAIEEYIKSAMNLTKQLLGFVRGGKYEVKPIDVNDLVTASTTMFGRTRKEIRIHAPEGRRRLVVEADKRQMEQVLLNMFLNAWQAMPKGGDIFVETSTVNLDEEVCKPHGIKPGPFVKISITDTGVGMNEAVRRRIFDPFFTTKKKKRGTGLGLASAYGIVKNHGGMIAATSKRGHGATFDIYLPGSDKTPQQKKTSGDRIVKGEETILLVDDEKMIVEVAGAMLDKLGYRVVPALGGNRAIEEMEKLGNEVDLVILDLVMPDMDGGKVFDRIREIRPMTPVLLSSGYARDGQAESIMQRGCNGFIQKPFNISELAKKVREILEAQKN